MAVDLPKIYKHTGQSHILIPKTELGIKERRKERKAQTNHLFLLKTYSNIAEPLKFDGIGLFIKTNYLC